MQKWMLWARGVAQWKSSWVACVKIWGALALKKKNKEHRSQSKNRLQKSRFLFYHRGVEIETEVS